MFLQTQELKPLWAREIKLQGKIWDSDIKESSLKQSKSRSCETRIQRDKLGGI